MGGLDWIFPALKQHQWNQTKHFIRWISGKFDFDYLGHDNLYPPHCNYFDYLGHDNLYPPHCNHCQLKLFANRPVHKSWSVGGVGGGSPYHRCYRQHDEDDHVHDDHVDVDDVDDVDEDDHNFDVDDVGGYNYDGQGGLFPCFILYPPDDSGEDDDDCNILGAQVVENSTRGC